MKSRVRPPTTRAANGAPGGARLLARASRPGTPPPPSKRWVPEARREGRPIARLARGADRKAPGASRRSIPPFGGKGKRDEGPAPGPEKIWTRDSEALAETGCADEGIFRRKPVPDLIRDVQRFAAENAINLRN